MRQVFEQRKAQHHYATLRKNGNNFEIIIKPEEAMEFRKGNISDISEVLEFEAIYSDARKGEIAADLEENFGTEDIFEIAKEILSKGSLQLTTEYKRALTEQKRKEVIDLICRNGIDARTKLPIPASRVELALEQVSVNFDPFKSAKEQLDEAVSKISSILPISFEEKQVTATVGSKYAGKIAGIISKYGKISKTDYKSDGTCAYSFSIPGGLADELFKKLNDFTHGDINIDLR